MAKNPTSKSASLKKTGKTDAAHAAVQPTLHQQGGPNARETQKYGDVVPMPHGMDAKVVKTSVQALNQVLADTITLRDMYKKHHWQVVGPTFNQLHLMYDEHFTAQVELVDMLAERIQILGGVSLAMAADIAGRDEHQASPARSRARVRAAVAADRRAHDDPEGSARLRREGGGRR